MTCAFKGNFFFIQNKINNPGKAKNVEKRKKLDHPRISTKKPEGEATNVLAIPMKDDNNAYCVAV